MIEFPKRLVLIVLLGLTFSESGQSYLNSVSLEELSSYNNAWTVGSTFNYAQAPVENFNPEFTLGFSVTRFIYDDDHFFIYYAPLPLGFGWQSDGYFGPSISIWSMGLESSAKGMFPSFNYRSSGYLYKDSSFSLKVLVHYAFLTPWQTLNLGFKARLLLRSNFLMSSTTSIDWDVESQVTDNWISDLFGYPTRVVTFRPFVQNFNFASRLGPKIDFSSKFVGRVTADLLYVEQKRFEYGAGFQFVYMGL